MDFKLREHETSDEVLKGFTDYIEEIKELLSLDLWSNIFLNCTMNEVLIFWLLYQKGEVNMSEIADYIHVPLNTATGIVSRMEKKELIERIHSKEDKRIVLISFCDKGRAQFKQLVDELMSYGMKVLGTLTSEELNLLNSMMKKVKDVLKEERTKEEPVKKVRKITIE